MSDRDTLAAILREARELDEYISEGPMHRQPTVARCGKLLAILADEVERLATTETPHPHWHCPHGVQTECVECFQERQRQLEPRATDFGGAPTGAET